MKAKALLISACSALWVSGALAQSSKWEYVTKPDPITDELRHYAGTVAKFNTAVAVICTKDLIYVTAKTAPFDMEMGDTRLVAWRVDNEKAVSQNWDNLSSGAAVFDEEAIAMAQAMKQASSRIVVRSGRKTVEFSADGSTAAISSLIEKCPHPMLRIAEF